jgi:hypothetical protein
VANTGVLEDSNQCHEQHLLEKSREAAPSTVRSTSKKFEVLLLHIFMHACFAEADYR